MMQGGGNLISLQSEDNLAAVVGGCLRQFTAVGVCLRLFGSYPAAMQSAVDLCDIRCSYPRCSGVAVGSSSFVVVCISP
jgi:hypothetical protein